ncbi:MAG: formate--tetrahydrofolate ligase [Acidimicrobiia bacterium]|nr:formate--tetrahydrofolate ligase [Acidimicrobiia bacterium]
MLEGTANLRQHIRIVRRHGVVPVVAINAFPTDFASAHQPFAAVCEEGGVRWAVAQRHADGGPGMVNRAPFPLSTLASEPTGGTR